MRLGLFGLAIIAATSSALTGVPMITPASIEAPRPGKAARPAVARPGAVPRFRRSRGTQARPAKRPNRMHISRRARRRHRRAA